MVAAAASSAFPQGLINSFAPELVTPVSESRSSYQDLWDLDNRVWVLPASPNTGSASRIVGDRVILNATNWPSLARPDGGVLSGRNLLLIEARELIIDMPLRFADGGLVVSAQSVAFGPQGVVTFAPPLSDYAQQFQITARQLSFRGGRKMPLAFTLHSPTRKFLIEVDELYDHSGALIDQADRAWTFIRNISLNRRINRDPDRAGGSPTVTLLQENRSYYQTMGNAYWPEATVMKLQRLFSRAPYEEQMHSFVLQKLKELEPVFNAVRGGIAETSALKLAQAISDDRDIFGLRESEVPMTPLGPRIQRFNQRLDALYGANGELKLWDSVATQASVSGAINTEAFNDITAKSRELEQQLAEIDVEAQKMNSQLSSIESEITTLNAELAAQENYVKQQIEAEQFRNPNDGVAQGVRALAVVGSIAFPAAAPFLAVASGLVSLQHALATNEGDDLSKVTDVISVVQNHVAIVEQSQALRSQWDAARSNFSAAKQYASNRQAMTEGDKERFTQFKASLEGMKKSASKLYEILIANTPTAELVFDDQRIENDPEIIRIVARRNNRVLAQTQAMERLAAALSRYEDVSTTVLQQGALLAEVQTLNLTNDRERLRLLQLADIVRRDAVASLATEATLLRRAVRYFTGRNLDIPPDVLLFPEGLASEVQSFAAANSPQTDEAFAKVRSLEAAHYRTILRAAESARQAAIDREGWNIEVPIPFTAHISDNTTNRDETRRAKMLFISSLNRLIADAIRAGGRSGSIPIPLEVSTTTTTTERSMLAGINVSKLTFTQGREPDSTFTLIIEHPRIGTIHRQGGAETFSDTRAHLVADHPDVSRWPISLPNTVVPDWKLSYTQDHILGRLSSFAPPFFTTYTVSIEVPTPQDWASAPQVQNIEMEFIVAKPA